MISSARCRGPIPPGGRRASGASCGSWASRWPSPRRTLYRRIPAPPARRFQRESSSPRGARRPYHGQHRTGSRFRGAEANFLACLSPKGVHFAQAGPRRFSASGKGGSPPPLPPFRQRARRLALPDGGSTPAARRRSRATSSAPVRGSPSPQRSARPLSRPRLVIESAEARTASPTSTRPRHAFALEPWS
jgi:hypothetical protein